MQYLATLLAGARSDFDEKGFVQDVMLRLLELELKDRIRWIAEVLQRHLLSDMEVAIRHIVDALPPPLDPSKTDDDFGQFILAPLGEFIVRNGAKRELLLVSLLALRELTMRFSMEDAMRTFLHEFPKETLVVYKKWVSDKNYHVRRLVSESMRPFLPWSKRVAVPWEIRANFLTKLHSDKTRYVTRSVANHLNDEAKINPTGVIKLLQEWKMVAKQDAKELQWMTRHALRTLIKQGNSDALSLLGFTAGGVRITTFALTPTILKPGEQLTLILNATSTLSQLVMIDYCIGFQKANGTQKEKVFKWKKLKLAAGDHVTLIKKHLLKADATTFKLYEGMHCVAVQVNGRVLARTDFLLESSTK